MTYQFQLSQARERAKAKATENREETVSEDEMVSSPPPPPPEEVAGFSDKNKEWLKPVKIKKNRKPKSLKIDQLGSSDGESNPELGEHQLTSEKCTV